jgi:hypothetical protein
LLQLLIHAVPQVVPGLASLGRPASFYLLDAVIRHNVS